MDLKQAKIIIIIVLLILNIGLFAAVFNNDILPKMQENTVADIKKILNNRGIDVRCEILSGEITALWLNVSPVGYNGKDIADNIINGDYRIYKDIYSTKYSGSDTKVIFKNNDVCTIKLENTEEIDVLDYENIKEKVLLIIKKAVGFEGDFILDNYNYYENGESYINYNYIQSYKGYKFFDNYINVKAAPDGIKEIEFLLSSINEFDKVSDRRLIPVESILLSNLVNMEGMAVIKMETGFKNTNVNEKGLLNKQIGLCLRIYLSDGSYKYYSMINGKEITD